MTDTVADLSALVNEAQATVADHRRIRMALAIVGATGAFVGGVMYGSQLGGRANMALVLASLGIAALAIDVVFRLGPGSLNDMDQAIDRLDEPRKPYPAPIVGAMVFTDKKRGEDKPAAPPKEDA